MRFDLRRSDLLAVAYASRLRLRFGRRCFAEAVTPYSARI